MTTVSMDDHISNMAMGDRTNLTRYSANCTHIGARKGNIVISATVNVEVTRGYGSIRYTVNGIARQFYRS